MTPEAQRLWNDKEFISKRIVEQLDFLEKRGKQLSDGELTLQRYRESTSSAISVLTRLCDREMELKNIVT